MRVRRAFTLVELLISLLITGIVMAAVISFFFTVFKSYELHQDITSAKQRGYIALAAIQPYVLNAGLGLPPDGDPFDPQAFHRAFDPGIGVVLPLFPSGGQNRTFSSFVQLAEDGEFAAPANDTAAKALWLVYSVASGIGTDSGFDLRRGVVFNDLRISKPLRPDQVAAPLGSIKRWSVFPSAQTPILVRDIRDEVVSSGTQWFLEGEAFRDNKVLPFDELHYLRAVKIYVNGGALVIDHLDGSSPQPIVDGILALWCEFSRLSRVLTVHVLARAENRRYPGVRNTFDGWPLAASPQPNELENDYRYAVVARSWRIRN